VNARDAMRSGGRLTVATSNVWLEERGTAERLALSPGPFVKLTVQDSGEGMSPGTLNRIYDPFFTTKPQGKGTGLGLSTVFGIVKQSGGAIWVASSLGEGTTFEVYFPRTDAPQDPITPPSIERPYFGSETILLVEDEDPVRAVALGIMRKYGYQVIEARSAGEALLICERYQGPIHALVSDVVMPQMNGIELAQRLKKIRSSLKVLCMSGYTDHSALQDAVLGGELAFLQKPITPDRLMRKVREVLDK